MPVKSRLDHWLPPHIINPPATGRMQTATDILPVITTWQREALTPVAADERIETLDVLRGFALFGILTVNMAWFSWPVEYMMMRQQLWETRADVIADWIVRFLAEGKFYPLFAFLFGLGDLNSPTSASRFPPANAAS